MCYTISVMNFVKRLLEIKAPYREKKRIVDFYQKSVEKEGARQIKKLVEAGLTLPVITL